MARSIVAEVEAEYGEPFWDVVEAYAKDGNSMQMTAKILGYAAGSSLWYLINKHNKKINFPPVGHCNAVQNPGPLSEDRKVKISRSRIAADFSTAGDYERRTGERAIDAILRMAPTHTITEVARFLGWNNVTPMRSWMKLRGHSVEFKKVNPVPPLHNPWDAIDLRRKQRESTHRVARNTL